MSRWIRSLQAQLFLWALLPVTFVIIALAFTGVYAHEQAMQDFVAERDLALAHLISDIAGDGVAYGAVGADGTGLSEWMPDLQLSLPSTAVVVDKEGHVVEFWGAQPSVSHILEATHLVGESVQQEGLAYLPDQEHGTLLIAYASVDGTDWTVLVQEPVGSLGGPILRFSGLGPIVAAVAGILSLLVLAFGWHGIIRPLQRLVQATGQVYWGDDTAISQPVGGVQEIQDLHLALAGMVDRIQGYETGMRDYLGAVARGQEAERGRLARELHDGPVQDLIALGQRAEMAQRMVERGKVAQARELLHDLRTAELETVEELRRLISALRPAYLEDLGFLPALEMLVLQADERTEAQVRLEKLGAVQRLNPEVELTAYRIAQEALNNALQHANASSIRVCVLSERDGLSLSIKDDGTGFLLPPRPDVLTQAGHFGLVGMQERATRMGGTLQVHSSPGEGTTITLRLPDQ